MSEQFVKARNVWLKVVGSLLAVAQVSAQQARSPILGSAKMSEQFVKACNVFS